MVYTGKLTEEELTLQKKFALLKKKRIELQQKKRQKPPPPTPQPPTKRAAEPANQEEAKELAKRVLAAQADKLRSENKGSGFKRSRHLERRLQNPDKAPAFQPFNSSGTPGESEDVTKPSASSDKRSQIKNLYANFISGGIAKSEDVIEPRKSDQDRSQMREKRRGKTIYVHAYGISHDLCDRAFKKFGSIANINVDKEKPIAFVTFDNMDAADKAIEEMNGNMVDGKTLKVSLARRQPNIDPGTDMNCPWAAIATGASRGNKPKDTRSVISYDEVTF